MPDLLIPQVHPRAVVHETAHLGADTIVWQFATVLSGVVTGKHCSIGSCAEVGRDTRLGDNVRIGHGVFLPGRSTVGDRVFIGPNVTFTDDRDPQVNNPHYRAEPPIIEADARIGAGATIGPGVRIGAGAFVHMGARVTRDVAPWTIVRGRRQEA